MMFRIGRILLQMGETVELGRRIDGRVIARRATLQERRSEETKRKKRRKKERKKLDTVHKHARRVVGISEESDHIPAALAGQGPCLRFGHGAANTSDAAMVRSPNVTDTGKRGANKEE